MENIWVAVFWSILPTIVVSSIFFFTLRSIIRADRTERRDYARFEAKERARLGLAPRRPDADTDGAASVESAAIAATER